MKRLFIFVCSVIPYCLLGQIKVEKQNASFPLTSMIDSSIINMIGDTARSPGEKERNLRNYLQPLCDANDALACFLLATSYDQFAQGKVSADAALLAKKYYHRAADNHMAEACMFLYQMYRYNFMQEPNDATKSMYYLQKAATYGNKDMQAQVYRELAGIYYPGSEKKKESDLKGIYTHIDSTIFYLQQSLLIDSTDTWTLDFLGGIYEDQKNYSRSLYYYSQSDNEQSRLKIALWMASGKKIPKNTNQAVKIVKDVLKKMTEEENFTPENIHHYMGVLNPAILLNLFYKCYHIIPREEVGKWYSGAITCDDFHER